MAVRDRRHWVVHFADGGEELALLGDPVDRRGRCEGDQFELGMKGLLKPIRHKPQSASNGDERSNPENAAQPAVLQAIETQPQPTQHKERGYEYTCHTL